MRSKQVGTAFETRSPRGLHIVDAELAFLKIDLNQRRAAEEALGRGVRRLRKRSFARRGNGKIRMASLRDLKTTIRRNMLLGMWAAEKLGLVGQDAERYAEALAMDTIDPERNDVFSKIRNDFNAASVVQSDEQILRVMNELILQAGSQMPATQGGVLDTAAVTLARNLTSR